MAIPATQAAQVGGSCRHSLKAVLAPRPFSLPRQAEFFFASAEAAGQFVSPLISILGQLLPLADVHADCLHVLFADIFEAELGATPSSLAGCKLPMEEILEDPAILHPADMSKPVEATSTQ